MRITVAGQTERVEASIVNGGETEGVYTARVTPPAGGFRVLVTGRDTKGFPFQRVNGPLFTATR